MDPHDFGFAKISGSTGQNIHQKLQQKNFLISEWFIKVQYKNKQKFKFCFVKKNSLIFFFFFADPIQDPDPHQN